MNVTHEVVYGPFTKTIYTVTPERLHVETKGGIGGASADIPVAAITGFFAVSRRVAIAGPRSAIVAASQTMAHAQGAFIVQWNEGGKRRNKSFTLNPAADTFQQLLEELIRLRPDASLCNLPSEAAHAKLGIWSNEKKVKVGVIAFIAALLVVGGALAAANPATHAQPTAPRAHATH